MTHGPTWRRPHDRQWIELSVRRYKFVRTMPRNSPNAHGMGICHRRGIGVT
jgi:hypothetical protein